MAVAPQSAQSSMGKMTYASGLGAALAPTIFWWIAGFPLDQSGNPPPAVDASVVALIGYASHFLYVAFSLVASIVKTKAPELAPIIDQLDTPEVEQKIVSLAEARTKTMVENALMDFAKAHQLQPKGAAA
jgi:hypothetical protein